MPGTLARQHAARSRRRGRERPRAEGPLLRDAERACRSPGINAAVHRERHTHSGAGCAGVTTWKLVVARLTQSCLPSTHARAHNSRRPPWRRHPLGLTRIADVRADFLSCGEPARPKGSAASCSASGRAVRGQEAAGLSLRCVRHARPRRTLSHCPERRRAREASQGSLWCAMRVSRNPLTAGFPVHFPSVTLQSPVPVSFAGPAPAGSGTLAGLTA